MISVIPNNMLGIDLTEICEVECFMMPQTIYTGTYPQIKINTDTLKDRKDLIGLGIGGIVTSHVWATNETNEKDILGISLNREQGG